MKFHEYQTESMSTAPKESTPREDLIHASLGLGGETGEVIELIKKHTYQGHPLLVEDLAKELGDVLWYVALMCRGAGLSLSEVARLNLAKLRARYPEGFDPSRSQERPAEKSKVNLFKAASEAAKIGDLLTLVEESKAAQETKTERPEYYWPMTRLSLIDPEEAG